MKNQKFIVFLHTLTPTSLEVPVQLPVFRFRTNVYGWYSVYAS